jgi:hypothetical protein
MMPLRTPLAAVLAAAAALAIGAPAAGASTFPAYRYTVPAAFAQFKARPVALSTPVGLPAAASCGPQTGNEGQGRTSGVDNSVCVGSGLSFVGPSVGGIATVMGPTIISPGFAGSVIVAGGNVAIAP